MRNDPSFMLHSSGSTAPKYPKNDKWAMNEGNRKAPISVYLTYVDLCSETPPSTARKKVSNSTKYCPLHKKPHPLQNCRAFREKSFDEHKSLLEQFGLCFRCCKTTDHFAKDCKVVVTCADCGRYNHATVLHQASPNAVLTSCCR